MRASEVLIILAAAILIGVAFTAMKDMLDVLELVGWLLVALGVCSGIRLDITKTTEILRKDE